MLSVAQYSNIRTLIKANKSLFDDIFVLQSATFSKNAYGGISRALSSGGHKGEDEFFIET